MNYSLKALDAAYHMSQFFDQLSRLSAEEIESLASVVRDHDLPPKSAQGLERLFSASSIAVKSTKKRRPDATFDEFRFEEVMQRVRNAVMHSPNADNAAELEWLVKIILASPAVFDSVRELDNFLSNMTATAHTTRSTGRDRIVEWYFRHINSLPDEERNRVYLKIARHIFAQSKSDYREWKAILYGGASR